jgi:hypothetical protein
MIVMPATQRVAAARVRRDRESRLRIAVDLCAPRRAVRRLADRAMRSHKSRQHLPWGRRQLQHHGVWIIIVARFIPGGRTAPTSVAGTVGMLWKRRFLPADGVAAVLWALYASGRGETLTQRHRWGQIPIRLTRDDGQTGQRGRRAVSATQPSQVRRHAPVNSNCTYPEPVDERFS